MELPLFISTGHTPVISKHSHSGAKSLTAQFSLQFLKMSFHLLALGSQYCCIQFLFLCKHHFSPPVTYLPSLNSTFNMIDIVQTCMNT